MDFFAKRKAILENGADHARLSNEQKEFYPTIAQLLEGKKDAKGECVFPAYSLTLFPGEGEVKFVFSSKETDEAWFGSAGPDAAILDAIEKSLIDGRVEARRDKKARTKTPF